MALHTVARGERLSEIAALHGVPVQDIVAANPQKPRQRLASGAVVFADLAEGETLTVGVGAPPKKPNMAIRAPRWSEPGSSGGYECTPPEVMVIRPDGSYACMTYGKNIHFEASSG
jgi:hypothetical protein